MDQISTQELERLRQENERFKQVLKASIIGLVALDSTGKFIFVNKTFLDMVLYDFGDLLGKSVDILSVGNTSIPEISHAYKKFEDGQDDSTAVYELSIKRKDGALIYIWISLQPLKDKEGKFNGVVCAVRDITEERETQGELWQIMNAITDYLWSAEIGKDKTFRYRYFSPVVERVTGRPPEFYIEGPKKLLEVVHDEDKEKLQRFFEKIQGEGIVHEEIEYRIVLPENEETRWVRDSVTARKIPGDRVILNGVASDITNYKKLQHDLTVGQKNLIRERAKDEALFSSIGEGFVGVGENLEITLINKAAQDILGWKDGEVLGKQWFDVAGVKTEKGVAVSFDESPLGQAIKLKRPVSTSFTSRETYFYTKKDGSTLPVAVTASPVFLLEELAGGVVVFRDITEEKKIDDMKKEFISIASHQLRTPLTAVKLYSEMLADGQAGHLEKEQKEYADIIEHSANRMIELVNDLLNISRIEMKRINIEPEPTELRPFIQEVVDGLKTFANKKGCNIKTNVPEEKIPEVPIDQHLLRQVLMNLLTNSIRYSKPNQCSVEVSLEIVREDQDPHIKIGVHDSGIGIPPEEHDRIFEKFYRADNAIKMVAEGSGLGLYIIKKVLEMAGGTLRFESALGEGTTFYVTIPVRGMLPQKGERNLESVKRAAL
jgi:PAS domain S-box-containing protein